MNGLPYEAIAFYSVAVSAPCFSSHPWLREFGGPLLVALAVSLGLFRIELVST